MPTPSAPTPDRVPLATRVAERLALWIGTVQFIVIQLVIMLVWVAFNTFALFRHEAFDHYPYVLLNLALSTQAAFATSIILIGNRRAERLADIRQQETHDHVMETHQWMQEAHDTQMQEHQDHREAISQLRDLAESIQSKVRRL